MQRFSAEHAISPGPRVSWRRLLVVVHRDIGYLCAGLTVIYAVSGIAVNPIEGWNPNSDVRRTMFEAGSVPAGDDEPVSRRPRHPAPILAVEGLRRSSARCRQCPPVHAIENELTAGSDRSDD